ncbi:DUF3761 domain-containing protein [Silvibacterium dinghuense]|nr:DUF3761 domain-containing protein [Silvibacterium dinghuense]
MYLVVMLAALFSTPALMHAQAPAGSTGQCKDGTYTSNKTKRGACGGHGGIGTWYASSTSSTAAAPASTPALAAKPAAASTPAPAAAAPAPAAAAKSSAAARTTPAPGGGNGQVWVNTDSHVYHCSGTRWYGKTKAGKYVTEAQAKAEGDKPASGKACSAN